MNFGSAGRRQSSIGGLLASAVISEYCVQCLNVTKGDRYIPQSSSQMNGHSKN